MKRLASAIGLAAIVAVMGLTTALAATEITAGNDVIDRQNHDTVNDVFLVDMNQPFTSAGEVEKWQIWAEQKVPVALAIFRFSNNAWSLVGESKWETPANTGLQEFTLSSKIKVKSGDYVGLRIGDHGGAVSFDLVNTTDWIRNDLLGSVKYTTASSTGDADFKGSADRKYSVKAIGTATDSNANDDNPDDEDNAGKDKNGINGNGRNFGTHLSGDEADTDSQAQGQASFKLSKDGDSLKFKLNVANIEDVRSAGLYKDEDGDEVADGTRVATLFDDDSIEGRFQGILAEGDITDDLNNLMDAIRAGHVYVAVFTKDSGDPEILGWLIDKGHGEDEQADENDTTSVTDDSNNDDDDQNSDKEKSEKVRGWDKNGHEKDNKENKGNKKDK